MKRLLLLIAVLALLLLPMSCAVIEGVIKSRVDAMIEEWTGNYTIKVGGTAGLNFTGEYEVWFFHFNPDPQSIVYTKDSYTVEGQVPQEYTFEGGATAVMFQKRAGDSWTLLEVEIWRDGELVAYRDTSDPWGAVSVVVALYE